MKKELWVSQKKNPYIGRETQSPKSTKFNQFLLPHKNQYTSKTQQIPPPPQKKGTHLVPPSTTLTLLIPFSCHRFLDEFQVVLLDCVRGGGPDHAHETQERRRPRPFANWRHCLLPEREGSWYMLGKACREMHMILYMMLFMYKYIIHAY